MSKREKDVAQICSTVLQRWWLLQQKHLSQPPATWNPKLTRAPEWANVFRRSHNDLPHHRHPRFCSAGSSHGLCLLHCKIIEACTLLWSHRAALLAIIHRGGDQVLRDNLHNSSRLDEHKWKRFWIGIASLASENGCQADLPPRGDWQGQIWRGKCLPLWMQIADDVLCMLWF